MIGAMRRAASGVVSYFSGSKDAPSSPSRARRPRRSRGVLFFLPAFFTPSHGIEVPGDRGLTRSLSRYRVAAHEARDSDDYPIDKPIDDLERFADSHLLAPPSYDAHSRASSSSDTSATVC